MQMIKETYKKTILTKEQMAAGNFEKYSQFWDIIYYEQHKDLMDKIVLRTYLKERETDNQEKRYALRSIYFKYPGQLKNLILELANSYIFFMLSRNDFVIPKPEYRKIMLHDLVKDIVSTQMERWKNENNS